MNPVEIVALDALDLLVVVDNESDTLSSVDKGVPQLPELGRLFARVPHRAPIDGHDCVEPWGHLCLACHGFSALVTGRRGSEERSVLFDVGPAECRAKGSVRRHELDDRGDTGAPLLRAVGRVPAPSARYGGPRSTG